MTKELAESFGQAAAADPSLASIIRSDSAVRELAEWLAFGSNVRHLEQEALDPRTVSQRNPFRPSRRQRGWVVLDDDELCLCALLSQVDKEVFLHAAGFDRLLVVGKRAVTRLRLAIGK
jgi:hypothetical protein